MRLRVIRVLNRDGVEHVFVFFVGPENDDAETIPVPESRDDAGLEDRPV